VYDVKAANPPIKPYSRNEVKGCGSAAFSFRGDSEAGQSRNKGSRGRRDFHSSLNAGANTQWLDSYEQPFCEHGDTDLSLAARADIEIRLPSP
jgi:hypothetical protein